MVAPLRSICCKATNQLLGTAKFLQCTGKFVAVVFVVEAIRINTKGRNLARTQSVIRYSGHFVVEVFIVEVLRIKSVMLYCNYG